MDDGTTRRAGRGAATRRDDNGEARIVEALEELRRRRPTLASLMDRLHVSPAGIDLSDAFLSAYHASDHPHRSMVLQALFADETLFRWPLANHVTPALARRFVRYLRSHPLEPLANGYLSREQLPQALRRWFGVERRAAWIDFIDALTVPLWEVATIGRPRTVPRRARDWPQETWEALLPLLNARHLTPERARLSIAEGVSTPFARYYFETVDSLAVRNLLVYLGELFSMGRAAGREQNRIPLQLARRFSVAPRSVPDALALLDVLALIHDGVARATRTDPCGIGALFDAPVPGSRARFWEPAIRSHRTRWILGPAYKHEATTGMFDTGLMFNVARASGLVEGTKSRLELFAPYYRTVDRRALWERCMPEWAAISPTNAHRCAALIRRSGDGPAIRLRDLGNIVSLRTLYGPEAPLPAVARFALGQAEPVATGQGRSGGSGRRPVAAGVPPRPFTALESLIRELDATPLD